MTAAPAFAADLQAGQARGASELQSQATSKSITTNRTFTWVKVGKQLYQWSNYQKAAKNGTLKPRETSTSYFEFKGGCQKLISVSTPKSSKSTIIAAKPITKYDYMKYNLKKVGSATITYVIKYVNDAGTTVTNKFVEKHRITHYSNPLSMLKVGSTDYAAKLKSAPQYVTKKAISGKVVARAAKGWKLMKIRRVNSAIQSGEYVPQKQVKNGTSVNIKKKKKSVLEVICYNTKLKYYESVILSPSFKYSVIYG